MMFASRVMLTKMTVQHEVPRGNDSSGAVGKGQWAVEQVSCHIIKRRHAMQGKEQ